MTLNEVNLLLLSVSRVHYTSKYILTTEITYQSTLRKGVSQFGCSHTIIYFYECVYICLYTYVYRQIILGKYKRRENLTKLRQIEVFSISLDFVSTKSKTILFSSNTSFLKLFRIIIRITYGAL